MSQANLAATKLPYVFIGSSSEGLGIARAVQAQLGEVCDSVVWDQEFFQPSLGYLESLATNLDKFDFAILIFSPDDAVTSRDVKSNAPRDNVLVELGMFIGRLGRSRTFALFQKDANLKIPSDLAGVTLVPHKAPRDGNLTPAVGAACFTISQWIQKFGVRQPELVTQALPVETIEERKQFEAAAVDRVDAHEGIVGEHTPAPMLDRWYDQLRPVLHQSTLYTTPTYWLDTDLNILDWNLAFDLVFGEITPLLRYRHVKEFIARLANRDAVFNHARLFSKRVAQGEMPSCDTEPLIYRSQRYGDVAMVKVATQLHDARSGLRGWVVSLLLRQVDWEVLQRDLDERINEDKLWGVYAGSYDRILQGFPPYQKLLSDVSSVVPEEASKVIDIGAGTGNSTQVLLDRGFAVTSVEQNAAMIDVMRSRNFDRTRHQVLKASAEDLENLRGLDDQSFDAATLVNVLYCLDDPMRCLMGVNRALKPGGVMGLSTTHAGIRLDPLLSKIKEYLQSNGTYSACLGDYSRLRDVNRRIENTIARRVTSRKYRDMIEAAGFEITRFEEFTYEGAVLLIHARKTS